MSLGAIVVVLIVILFLWHLHLRFSYAGRLLARIPGPKSWPIFGNTFIIIKPPEQLFLLPRTIFREYGNICKLEAFGIRTVHIFSPEDVEILISTTKFNEKREPYTFLKPWLREGLLVSNDVAIKWKYSLDLNKFGKYITGPSTGGKKWHQRRKLLTPAFHFNILKKHTQIFIDHTEEFLAQIKETGMDKLDLLPLISKATLNIMCQTSMGTSFDERRATVANKYLQALQTIGKVIAHRIIRIWLYVEFTFKFFPIYATQRKAITYLHDFTIQIIRERKMHLSDINNVLFGDNNKEHGFKGPLALLDLLIKSEEEGHLDLEGIREEVDTFMFEGHDTTAMALSFFIMRLANEPKAQDRLSEEMLKIFGDSERSPTIDDLNDMKYLECCIKESLRLYPSVPFIARYTTDDVTLSGYKVPAGTQCHIHVFDIHYRQDNFPEPEKFIPERFLPQNSAKRHKFSYIPFSAGPRNCIGQKFAMLEMKTLMSGLIRRYRLEPITTPENITYTADIVLRTLNPLYVRLRPK